MISPPDSPASTAAPRSPLERSLAALSRLDGTGWAHCGDLALLHYGVLGAVELLHVLALEPLAPALSARAAPPRAARQAAALEGLDWVDFSALGGVERVAPGTVRWLPAGGLPILWSTPAPHYEAFWRAAMATAAGSPALLSPAALVAALIQRRADPALLVDTLVALDKHLEDARAFTLAHLGPYAVDDLERLAQDAEWAMMRQPYTDEGRLF